MRTQYPIFQSHLDLAHNFWKKLLQKGDTVVDATAGNGHDSLLLAELALTQQAGALYAFDIQKEALESSKKRLQEALDQATLERVTFCHMCHSKIGEIVPKEAARLIVYNLGYLPGSDKAIKTDEKTTLISIQAGLELLKPGGALSITCYPGHPEGLIEEQKLVEFFQTLAPTHWNVSLHRFINRKNAPSLLLVQRA